LGVGEAHHALELLGLFGRKALLLRERLLGAAAGVLDGALVDGGAS
jgi:hypothetical protein